MCVFDNSFHLTLQLHPYPQQNTDHSCWEETNGNNHLHRRLQGPDNEDSICEGISEACKLESIFGRNYLVTKMLIKQKRFGW